MGGLMGGGQDNSAMYAQIEAQKQETERLRKQAEQDKQQLAADMASKRKARQRNASALLSPDRLNPEEGIDTLGSSDTSIT
jgi:hypothetical protein